MQVQTKAIIITAIGICSLFFLSSVEAAPQQRSAFDSAKQLTFATHVYNHREKKYKQRHKSKSSSRHKREKIGALIGGVIIGSALANNLSHGSHRSSRDKHHYKSPRGYDPYYRHDKKHRDRYYHDRKRYHRDKNYTGYKGYRKYNHRDDYYDRYGYPKSRHHRDHYRDDHRSSKKRYAPSYELRRDHNNRLSCYRVKMYRKGEKVLERVNRDYCGW